MHEDRVVEVYWISHEDREAREADHVRTCDETIAPGNLHAADKRDLCRGLTATVDKAKSRPMSSWLTLLMASMAYSLTTGSSPPHMGPTLNFPKAWALDLATGWDFTEPSQRREARQLVNEQGPRAILLSSDNPEENYGAKLAAWQYRVGNGFVMHTANLSQTTHLSQLAHLPGVSTKAYGSSGWTVSRTGEGESPAILLRNVDDVAKAVHKRLHRE